MCGCYGTDSSQTRKLFKETQRMFKYENMRRIAVEGSSRNAAVNVSVKLMPKVTTRCIQYSSAISICRNFKCKTTRQSSEKESQMQKPWRFSKKYSRWFIWIAIPITPERKRKYIMSSKIPQHSSNWNMENLTTKLSPGIFVNLNK